jgi:hypothetical protein
MEKLEVGEMALAVAKKADSAGMIDTAVALSRIAVFLLESEAGTQVFFDAGMEKTSPPRKHRPTGQH